MPIAVPDLHQVYSNFHGILVGNFYFSLPTAAKHVLADFCNAPSVRL